MSFNGGWSDEYTIRERPFQRGGDGPWELPVLPGSGWWTRGRTSVAGLRFEHHERTSCVVGASLARALARAGA